MLIDDDTFFDLYTAPSLGISELLKPNRLRDATKQTKAPAIKKKLEQVKKNKIINRPFNSKAMSAIGEAKALDKKIKSSKAPSYEDLKQFHKLSTDIEESL